ncbi:hypothetical protein YH65_08200 [Sulfurovum lithotrophicum]|uniref:Uncharacterized protein n=1 Tax=Sulfurovum lithotrophicum TaxID=206403 RepID=A0A7U4M214_9BACT|nr:hypothetical protein [Sulfurovum lithotrophicum]AKF25370.1 hypothetical protein YH65_08200 [Sulfurovum lithotrophicum]
MVLSFGQLYGVEDMIAQQSVIKSIFIVKSTKSYSEAKEFAQKLAKKSGVRLDLRALKYNEEIMISHPRAECDENGYAYPCYIARGRYDDGVYLSVEPSDAYEEFTKGYYIVVAASGEKVDKSLLNRIRHYVPDAYVKRTTVYMGCIH